MIRQLRLRWGLDAEVLATLALRGWSVLAGLLTVLLVPLWLSADEQGYWYTFASLVALQLFFELGMNQVVLQLASHEAAHAGRDPAAAARLASLVRLVDRWWGVAALGFVLAVGPAGALFLHDQGHLPQAHWLGPWCAVVLGTAAALLLSARLTLQEGCGRLADVARLRLLQSAGGSVLAWAVLAAGGSLWAAAAVPWVGALCTLAWLRRQPPVVAPQVGPATGQPALSWRQDILPFQWRIALSWVSGWFIFQAFTPLAFAHLGARQAGQLGISLAVFSSVQAVGMSWVHAKSPQLAGHVARGERAAMLALFHAVSRRGVGFVLLAGAGVVVTLAVLQQLWPGLAQRFAPLPVLACLAVTTALNACIFAAASLMRAHKQEPMVWVSAASGLATVAVAAAAAPHGLLPMMAAWLAVTAVLTLPWTLMLLRRYTAADPARPEDRTT